MVHYIKLFAPLFSSTRQDKHTTAGSRKSKMGATCSWLTKHYPHMVYIQASILVHIQDQANSSHPSPQHIHNVCSPLKSSQLLFHSQRKTPLRVTNWSSLIQRKGNSCGGRAAREAVTFSHYGLTNLFPSMWQNVAHTSFIGFTVQGYIVVEHNSMFFRTINTVWMMILLLSVWATHEIKLYLKYIWSNGQLQRAWHLSNAFSKLSTCTAQAVNLHCHPAVTLPA